MGRQLRGDGSLIWAECNAGLVDDVVKHTKLAVALDPFTHDVEEARDRAIQWLNSEGAKRYRDGDYAQAIVAYDGVLQLEPNNAEAQRWVSEARRQAPNPSREPLPPEVEMRARAPRAGNPRVASLR